MCCWWEGASGVWAWNGSCEVRKLHLQTQVHHARPTEHSCKAAAAAAAAAAAGARACTMRREVGMKRETVVCRDVAGVPGSVSLSVRQVGRTHRL